MATHPRQAQTYSRSLPLFARAGRPPLPGILSTKPSLLLPGAFGLVPPLHDDKPRISVPKPPLRLRSQNHQLPCSALCGDGINKKHRSVPKVASNRISLHSVRCSPPRPAAPVHPPPGFLSHLRSFNGYDWPRAGDIERLTIYYTRLG